jgi:hypothetical protein
MWKRVVCDICAIQAVFAQSADVLLRMVLRRL